MQPMKKNAGFCFAFKASIRSEEEEARDSAHVRFFPAKKCWHCLHIYGVPINITQMLFSINILKCFSTCISSLCIQREENMNLLCIDNVEGVKISTREAPPADYIFEVQSFSWLSKNSIDKYDSSEFESGGYKWKLSLYPDGNKNKKGKDHISLYLVIVDKDALPSKWEVHVTYRQICDA